MRLKILWAAFSLYAACAASVMAETPDLECSAQGKLPAAEALQVLERVQNEYLKITNLKAKFSQSSYLAALEEAESSSGTVWFSKPGKMKWHYAEPEEQVYIVLDDSLYLYQVPDKQVTIDKISKVLISDLPLAFLMGIGKVGDNFDLLSACRREVGIILRLKPKKQSSESGLEIFYLIVDPKGYFPVGAKVNDVGGNVTTVILKELEFSPKLSISETVFSTDFPSDTYIDDLRVKG